MDIKKMSFYQKWLNLDIVHLPSKCIDEKASLPKCGCIYFFIENHQITYIGRTGNLHQRINKPHQKLEKYQKVLKISWLEVKDKGERYMGESILISRFKPCFNINIQNELSQRPILDWLLYLIFNENDLDEKVINKRKEKRKK